VPVLEPGRMVRSRTPTLVVENKFDPGTYRFRLVVIDDEAHVSTPDELLVTVLQPPRSVPSTRETIVSVRSPSGRLRASAVIRRRPPKVN